MLKIFNNRLNCCSFVECYVVKSAKGSAIDKLLKHSIFNIKMYSSSLQCYIDITIIDSYY